MQRYIDVQPVMYTRNIKIICFKTRLSRFVNGTFLVAVVVFSAGAVIIPLS
jgi:hypothetical protein